MEERPFRIREAEGSNPSVSTFCLARRKCEMTKKVDLEGFEPSAFRMQNGRSSTELKARAVRKEATEGIEPSTLGLQDRCSATEPSRHAEVEKTPAAGIEPATSSSVARCSSIEPRGRVLDGRDETVTRNRGLTVKILAFQARDPGSTPGGCTFYVIARPRGAMEARRFPEPEVEGSTPSAGAFSARRPQKSLAAGV